MAASVISRTISAVVDQKLLLNGQQIGRTLAMGTNWNRLKIGMRYCCDPNGNTGDFTPLFALGMCSGTSNMYADATTTNFLGFNFRAGISWTLINSVWFQAGGAPLSVVKRVGSTTTALSVGLSSAYGAGSTTWRSWVILDITKGSPNYTVGIGHYTTGSVNDTSYETFVTYLEQTPSPLVASAAVAYDEIAGALDTVNIYWGTTTRNCEISEVLVNRIA